MPIVKYVAVHTTPLSNIEYILNGDKNDEMKFATGINCTANPQEAYDEFRRTFEICAKERFFKSEIVADKDKSEKPKQKEKCVFIITYNPFPQMKMSLLRKLIRSVLNGRKRFSEIIIRSS